MKLEVDEILRLAQEMQGDFSSYFHPPDEGYKSPTQRVISNSVVKNTRGYIEIITNQINGCFENGWYDACAVMMRRLLETVIIEVFEAKKMENKIKNVDGDYLYLSDLINVTLQEESINLGRNAKKSIRRLKNLGDMSAHSRRFNANYHDVDKVQDDFRITIQELIYLAELK